MILNLYDLVRNKCLNKPHLPYVFSTTNYTTSTAIITTKSTKTDILKDEEGNVVRVVVDREIMQLLNSTGIRVSSVLNTNILTPFSSVLRI
ncbi:hypothetical protein DPMN_113021 [Dreissena polymorpha]|uniref:Uncharacterized protein n=1 Tax=Dreissena polymorpha TaxID=45954 RepID=A0A9D4KHI1_DREPO|nr:hypothetical protein DPMN_113021 [Dreissena polymorpha]